MLDHHETLSGQVLDMAALWTRRPADVRWLLQQALTAPSWTELQARTARGAFHAGPDEDDFYRLQLDLVGQTGVATGGLSGTNTATYGQLLYEQFLLRERSSMSGLFLTLHAAELADAPIEETLLHPSILGFRREHLAPPSYSFVVQDGESITVHSDALAADFDELRRRALVEVNSPIHTGPAGQQHIARWAGEYPALVAVLRDAARRIRPPPEVLDGLYRTYDFVACRCGAGWDGHRSPTRSTAVWTSLR